MEKEEVQDSYIGWKIDGRYLVEEMIQTLNEGYHKVYWLKDIKLNKRVIMHVFDKTNPIYNTQEEYFRSESEALFIPQHEMLLKTIDIIEGENDKIIIKEVIDDVLSLSLKQLLEENKTLSVEFVVKVAICICDLFRFLYHRTPPQICIDIKPSNVILLSNQKLKVHNITIVKISDAVKENFCMFATKGYAAPEQYGGAGQIDIRTSIYNLGMIMYHLLTGKNPAEPPYEILPVRQINPQIPKKLEDIIVKCIKPNPNERYQTCEDLMTALQGDLRDVPKKKGFLSKLFGGKHTKKEINPEVKKIWDGMKKEYREKVFYGDIFSAEIILNAVTITTFGNITNQNIAFSYQVYLQTWIRSHGGLTPVTSTPSYIKQALCERFSAVDSNIVLRCVTQSLDEIYRREPILQRRVQEFEQFAERFQKSFQEDTEKNKSIENLYINDPDYGLVPHKPIFVNGFGNDREYLSHLYTDEGVKLSFVRVGSVKVDEIAGPVDFYRLLLPDNTDYIQVYVCNYGSEMKRKAPLGTRYID